MTSAQSAPRVSVVIPCHNRADTIVEAIRSVLEQTYGDLEVIVVDDASTDDTVAVVEAMGEARVRVAHNPGPRGPSAARNCGVALSDAPWIAFQDSDDIWLPDKLAAQMAQLEDSPFVASYCGMLIKADTQPGTPTQDRVPHPDTAPLSGDILPSLTQGSYISTQMLVIRRDVFDAVGGFDADLSALVDWELMLRVAQEGPVDFVDQDLVVQRMSDNSITRSTRKRLAAQEYVLAKHGSLLARYPGALARQHHRVSGGHRTFGNYRAAADHAAQALKAGPWRLRDALKAMVLRARALVS